MIPVDDGAAGAEHIPPDQGFYVIERHMKGAGRAWLSPVEDRLFSCNDITWTSSILRAWVYTCHADARKELRRMRTDRNGATIEPYPPRTDPAWQFIRADIVEEVFASS